MEAVSFLLDIKFTGAVPNSATVLNPPPPQNINDDFSSNTHSDILERSARFYDRAEFREWCQSSHVKYTEGFRDLILQINPYYIPCVYKSMFETCVTGNLRMAEGDGLPDKDTTEDTKLSLSSPSRNGSYSAPSTPRPGQQGDITNHNSCVYHGSASSSKASYSKDLCAWELCERRHSVSGTGYQKITAEEERDLHRRQVKTTYYRVLSPKTFTHSFKNMRHSHGINCGYGGAYAPAKSRKVSRERYEDAVTGSQSSSSSNVTSSACSSDHSKFAEKRFKHHKKNSSFIEQYREDFTYPRLKDNVEQKVPTPVDVYICSCGSHTCPRSMTSSSGIQRWYPNQSQTRDHVATCEKAHCVTSGVSAPKRKPILKKRPGKTPIAIPPYIVTQKVEETQKMKAQSVHSNQGNQRMEFFANSLTVTNFNPKRASISSTRVAASSSTSLVGGSDHHSNTGSVACTASDTSTCRVKSSDTAELLARLCSFKDPTVLYTDLPGSV